MALQVPSDRDPQPDEKQEGEICFSVAWPVSVPSLESQLKLRALYEYVESSRNSLDYIGRHLSLLESSPGCSACLKEVSRRLGDFCIKADSWGFDSLYETSLGLQTRLIGSEDRVESEDFRIELRRGLATLSVLLDQCEEDFCQRLAKSDLLEGTDPAACS